MNLAVDLVMGEAGTGLSEDSGAFYQALLAQLDPLKQNISAALQDITENGLTLDKQKIVSDYLGQMAEITSMITEAENAAKLQMIQGKYAGAALDADSFQNLQAELANYTEQAIQSTDEAYQKVLTSLNAQRLAGEKGMEGGISQEEFDARSAEAAQSYYQSKAETILNGQQAMVDTIMATYGDEIDPVLETVNQKLDEKVREVMKDPYNMLPEDFMQGLQWAIDEAMGEAELPSDAQDALGMLVKGMEPSEEQMTQLINQMKQSGQAVPQAFLEGMQSIDMIQAASGDEEGLWGTVGQIIAESPEQALVLEAARQQGAMFPQAAFNAIEAEYPNADTAAQQFLEHLKSSFETGIDANVPVSVSINTIMTPEGQAAVGKLRNKYSAKNLPGHAEGGIFDTPHIAAFAEKGPEAVVPLDGSQKAISIWQEAGKILGAYDKNSYSRIYETISDGWRKSGEKAVGGYGMPAFQPVVNIYGNTRREDVSDGLIMTFEVWKEYMERYEDGRRRVSF